MASKPTETLITEMINYLKKNPNSAIYPMMWQPRNGRSNTVSAAIKVAIKRGDLVEADEKDGNGNPYYQLPQPRSSTPNKNSPWYQS